MTITEGELHSVTADVFGFQHRQILRDRPWIENSKSGDFVDAARAHALRPQVFYREDTDVPVTPAYGYLIRARLGYVDWGWVVHHNGQGGSRIVLAVKRYQLNWTRSEVALRTGGCCFH